MKDRPILYGLFSFAAGVVLGTMTLLCAPTYAASTSLIALGIMAASWLAQHLDKSRAGLYSKIKWAAFGYATFGTGMGLLGSLDKLGYIPPPPAP